MFSLFLSLAVARAYALAGALLALDPSVLGSLVAQPQFWAVLLAPITSAFVSVIKQPGTPKWLKVVLMCVASVSVGTLTVYAAGQLDVGDWITTVGLAIAATEVAYRALLRRTGVSLSIEAFTILPWIHKAFVAAQEAERAEKLAAGEQAREFFREQAAPPESDAEGDSPAA
jgi:hypothetical protein